MNKRIKLDVLKSSRQIKQKNFNLKNLSKSDTYVSKYFENEEGCNVSEDSNTLDTINEIQNFEESVSAKCDDNVVKSVITVDSKHIKTTSMKQVLYPKNWKQHLENIKLMRRNSTAPVDNMGCHKCADNLANGPNFRFQTLIALMLSSQTKDEVTFEAMKRLKAVTCTAESIAYLPDEKLGQLIYPVSFWKRKVQYLKKTALILLKEYNGDIPNNVHDLCKLPGVGPKMAHICMQAAWNEITGIGVDTHVHRIVNRLKWIPKPSKSPEETRIMLEMWLPTELWKDINHLFVGFGQEICRSQKPKCSDCLNNPICPYVNKEYEF